MARMTALWMMVTVAALAGGCTTCHHQACRSVLEAGPDCTLPLYNRQHVHIFLVNGVAPPGLEGLRDRLNEHGFPKVYCGQLPHAVWMGQELRRVAGEEPEAKFVIVGYDLGGAAAVKLATDAIADQIQVEAVILLDPVASDAAAIPGVRTLLVTSVKGAFTTPHTERLTIPDAGRFGLPTHLKTVAVVCNVLFEVASRIPPPPPAVETDWSYEHAPPVSPVTPALSSDPAWNFLRDIKTAPSPSINPLRPSGYNSQGIKVQH